MTQLPSLPFYSTQAERVERARRRDFDEGLPPSGVVSDAVSQPWARIRVAQYRTIEDFQIFDLFDAGENVATFKRTLGDSGRHCAVLRLHTDDDTFKVIKLDLK